MPDQDPLTLPARVAHVTHALMARSRDNGGGIPVTTYEVCEYDSEAPTPASTYGALRRAIEDRFLTEVDCG